VTSMLLGAACLGVGAEPSAVPAGSDSPHRTGMESARVAGRYAPSWDSLDKRSNPAWFDDEKIGIFIRWSVFSVPAIAYVYADKPDGYGGHSCWYGLYVDRLRLLSPPEQAKMKAFLRATYGDVPFKALAPLFKAEAFDPRQWAALFKQSGARYAFLTANFHDGYCLWPSPWNPEWNSAAVGPKRDVLGEFSQAVREAGLRAGFYYSLGEFNHPLYRAARTNAAALPRFVHQHLQPQLREAVKRYQP